MMLGIEPLNGQPGREFEDHNGFTRLLGHVTSSTSVHTFAVPEYAATGKLIPESKWVEFDHWDQNIKIKDQGSYGACNGHAAATGLEVERSEGGGHHVAMSAWWVYGTLCQGWDVGSNILDAMALIRKGCAPEALVPYGTIDPKLFSPEAVAAAPLYQGEIAAEVKTREAIMTAVQRHESLNLAVCVEDGFDDLDAEGVAHLGKSMTNHAVYVGMGAKHSRRWGWLVKMANSWGANWGLAGFCWLPLDRLASALAFQSYVLRAARPSPGETAPNLV